MIFLFTCFVFLIYFGLIVALIYGNVILNKCPHDRSVKNRSAVSVIVPFRNEKKQLPIIYQCLKSQEYEQKKREVIFINDHSTDGGDIELKQWIVSEPHFKCLDCKEGQGKKYALNLGIEKAANDLIITTDADVFFKEQWLDSMVKSYLSVPTNLLVGPVVMQSGKSFYSALMQLEFSSLMATTRGAIGIQKPILCNGANLAFSKRLYLKLQPHKKYPGQASGDDVFLLHEVKRVFPKDAAIHYANRAEALVYIKPMENLSEFFHQRLRWGGKSKSYKDRATIFTGWIVLIANVWLLALFVLTFLLGNSFYLLPVFLFKWGLDYCLLRSIPKWMRSGKTFVLSFFLSLIYPFYLLTVALLSLLIKPKWKERSV